MSEGKKHNMFPSAAEVRGRVSADQARARERMDRNVETLSLLGREEALKAYNTFDRERLNLFESVLDDLNYERKRDLRRELSPEELQENFRRAATCVLRETERKSSAERAEKGNMPHAEVMALYGKLKEPQRKEVERLFAAANAESQKSGTLRDDVRRANFQKAVVAVLDGDRAV